MILTARYHFSEDEVQDTLVKWLEADPKPRHPRTWAYRVAMNIRLIGIRQRRGQGSGPRVFVSLQDASEPAIGSEQGRLAEAREKLRLLPSEAIQRAMGEPFWKTGRLSRCVRREIKRIQAL